MSERESIKFLIELQEAQMTIWTPDELDRIGSADELELASAREDRTLRAPVIMWVVRDRDDLYVRAVNGPESAWFRGARSRHEARIRAGGVEKDVSLVETEAANDEVDAAYHSKYDHRYPSIVPRIVAAPARAATLKLVPR